LQALAIGPGVRDTGPVSTLALTGVASVATITVRTGP